MESEWFDPNILVQQSVVRGNTSMFFVNWWSLYATMAKRTLPPWPSKLQILLWISPILSLASNMTLRIDLVQSMTKQASTDFIAGARTEASAIAASSLVEAFSSSAASCLGVPQKWTSDTLHYMAYSWLVRWWLNEDHDEPWSWVWEFAERTKM